MFDYLFFDLDGTLTDPALGITNSFIYVRIISIINFKIRYQLFI